MRVTIKEILDFVREKGSSLEDISTLKFTDEDGNEFEILLRKNPRFKPKPDYSGALFTPAEDEECWLICYNHLHGEYRTYISAVRNTPTKTLKNVFKTRDHALQYADALNVMHDLRKTSQLPINGVKQYCIELSSADELRIYTPNSVSAKFNNVLPVYETFQEAKRAIGRVGTKNIIAAVKVLKGAYNG